MRVEQITLGMHNYHDATNWLPHDITDKAGKPLLSSHSGIIAVR